MCICKLQSCDDSISGLRALAAGCAEAELCSTPLHRHACASSSASAAAGRLRERPGGITQRLGGLAEEANQRKVPCVGIEVWL